MRISGRPRGGAAAIEFALVCPFVFMIFFAFVEHGRYAMIANLVQNACREGARYAAVTTSDADVDDADIIAWVDAQMVGQQYSLVGYTVSVFRTDGTGANLGTWKNAQYGQFVAVRLEGTHSVWLPLLTFLPPTIDIDRRAISVAEAN